MYLFLGTLTDNAESVSFQQGKQKPFKIFQEERGLTQGTVYEELQKQQREEKGLQEKRDRLVIHEVQGAAPCLAGA